MSDIYDSNKRSKIMSGIKNKNTKPEIKVRKILCSLGYGQYRLSTKQLKCRPDIIYAGRKKAIFVNGCFWHGHSCKKARLPETNRSFWEQKVAINRERDLRDYQELCDKGWSYLVIWECELKKRNEEALRGRLKCFMEAACEVQGEKSYAREVLQLV